MSVFVELFVGGLFLTAGDLVFKEEIRHLSWIIYVLGIALYVIGLMFLIPTYTVENIAIASALFVIFNIITLTFVSWLWFKEPVTFLQALGLILSFGAILLLRP